MRKCIFGFHKWSKWSNLEVKIYKTEVPLYRPKYYRNIDEYTYQRNDWLRNDGYELSKIKTIKNKSYTQKRNCLNCNKIEIRYC
jgi:hypothetical protein